MSSLKIKQYVNDKKPNMSDEEKAALSDSLERVARFKSSGNKTDRRQVVSLRRKYGKSGYDWLQTLVDIPSKKTQNKKPLNDAMTSIMESVELTNAMLTDLVTLDVIAETDEEAIEEGKVEEEVKKIEDKKKPDAGAGGGAGARKRDDDDDRKSRSRTIQEELKMMEEEGKKSEEKQKERSEQGAMFEEDTDADAMEKIHEQIREEERQKVMKEMEEKMDEQKAMLNMRIRAVEEKFNERANRAQMSKQDKEARMSNPVAEEEEKEEFPEEMGEQKEEMDSTALETQAEQIRQKRLYPNPDEHSTRFPYESQNIRQGRQTGNEAYVAATEGLVVRNPIQVNNITAPPIAPAASSPEEQNANNVAYRTEYNADIVNGLEAGRVRQERENAILEHEQQQDDTGISTFDYGRVSAGRARASQQDLEQTAQSGMQALQAEYERLRELYEQAPANETLMWRLEQVGEQYEQARNDFIAAQQLQDLENMEEMDLADIPDIGAPDAMEGFYATYDEHAETMGFAGGEPRGAPVRPPAAPGAPRPPPSAMNPLPLPPAQRGVMSGAGTSTEYDISQFISNPGPSGAIGGAPTANAMLGNLAQSEQQEDAARQQSSVKELKEQIKCMLIVFKPLVEKLRTPPEQKMQQVMMKTDNREALAKYHKYLSSMVRDYYGQSQLKVGVIVSPESLASMSGGGGSGAKTSGTRLTKSGEDKFVHTQSGYQETMRGGRNSFAIMENRVPISNPQNHPIPGRIPQFLGRARNPYPSLLLATNPMAGLDLRLKPARRVHQTDDEY